MTKQKRPEKIIPWIVLILLTLVFSFIAFYLGTASPASALAKQTLQSDSKVSISQHSKSWLVFQPLNSPSQRGFIFYPGGKVEAKAYAPLARALAEAGHLVVIVPMPFNLAVFSPEAGLAVPAAFPSIQAWAIGGHSLGGVMAAQALAKAWKTLPEPNMTAQNPSPRLKGLVLLAAYVNPPTDFSQNQALKALVITASRDTVLNQKSFQANKKHLPPATTYLDLEGGNHGQFGSYGLQAGDGQAVLSPLEQTSQVSQAIAGFITEL